MTDYDAFEEEMSTDVAKFLKAVREGLPGPPDPRLEADLVPRMAAMARTENATAPVAPRRSPGRAGLLRLALPARIALGVFALLLSTAGLAVAGVSLPGPVDSAFEKAGVNLPNQASPESVAPPSAPDETRPAQGSGSDNTTQERKPGSPPKHKGSDKAPHGSNGRGQGSPASPGSPLDSPGKTEPPGPQATPPGQARRDARALGPRLKVPRLKPHRGLGRK